MRRETEGREPGTGGRDALIATMQNIGFQKWFQLRLLCIFVVICLFIFVLPIASLSCLDWNFSVFVSIGCSGLFILHEKLGSLVSLFHPRPKSANATQTRALVIRTSSVMAGGPPPD